MNALTKLFVVLQFICSLLLAAGIVVFVNKTEDYRIALEAEKAKTSTAQTNVTSLTNQLDVATNTIKANEIAKANEVAVLNTSIHELTDQNTAKDVQIALKQSELAAKEIYIAGVADALRASEDMCKGLQTALTTQQQSYAKSVDKVRELNVAIDVLQGSNDRLEKMRQVLEEEKVQNTKQISLMEAAFPQFGAKWNRQTNEVEMENGKPVVRASGQIIGRIVDTTVTGDVHYATISVGTSDNVTKDMKFYIVNGQGEFYGILTVDNVQPTQAIGRIDGPADKVGQIQKGLEVKTQL